jgi:hypothetical protein
VFELRDPGQPAVVRRVLSSRMQREQQHDREPDRDPCEVPAQGLRPSGRIPSSRRQAR